MNAAPTSAFLSPLRPHRDNYLCDTCCVANVVALDMGSFFLVLSVFFRIFEMHCEHHLYPQTQIANVIIIISTTIYNIYATLVLSFFEA
jgi:hypothetical protein